MTLKDRFKVISCSDCDMPYCDIKCTNLSEHELDKLEKIADDYAIEFSEWCLQKGLYTQFKVTQKATKELLEIFKKEKGYE